MLKYIPVTISLNKQMGKKKGSHNSLVIKKILVEDYFKQPN